VKRDDALDGTSVVQVLVLIAIACAWQVRVLARNNWPTARFCFTFVNIINTKARRQNDM